MTMSNISNLKELIGCSLHQDWKYDFASPEAAIEYFLEGYEVEELKEMHSDLENLLQDPEIPKDAKTLRRLGCFYNPEASGESVAEWLGRLGQRIEREILSRSNNKT